MTKRDYNLRPQQPIVVSDAGVLALFDKANYPEVSSEWDIINKPFSSKFSNEILHSKNKNIAVFSESFKLDKFTEGDIYQAIEDLVIGCGVRAVCRDDLFYHIGFKGNYTEPDNLRIAKKRLYSVLSAPQTTIVIRGFCFKVKRSSGTINIEIKRNVDGSRFYRYSIHESTWVKNPRALLHAWTRARTSFDDRMLSIALQTSPLVNCMVKMKWPANIKPINILKNISWFGNDEKDFYNMEIMEEHGLNLLPF